MTNHEQTQAELLDQFRQSREGTPPAELDAGVAAVAVMLEDHLSPPAPSARFVQNLGRRLDADASHTGNHSHAGIAPPLPDQTIPPSTPPNTPGTDGRDEPRRSWIFEAGRIAAAGLAIALVGTILMLVFRDADDAVAPGAGETIAHPGEILISWDPNGGEDYKLFIVDTDSGEVRKLNYGSAESGGVFSDGPAEADGISERYATWSPDGQKIAFVREQAGQSDIIVMNADGSDPVNVTNSPDNEAAPIWSPDGSQIAFTREDGGPFTAVHVMNPDGSNVRQITDYSGSAGAPTWSPDGSQIAFTRIALAGEDQGQQNIWVMNADGSDARQITALNASMGAPIWSPDGEHIAFGAWMQAWIVALDGSEPRSLMDDTSVAFSLPAWSPDGQRIAYAAGRIINDGAEITGDGIAIVNPDGEIQEHWTGEPEAAGTLAWSPDGNQLAFYGGDLAPENLSENVIGQLYIAATDGSGERSILSGAALDMASSPAWRPPITGDPPPVGPTPTAIPSPEAETGTDLLYVVTSNDVTVTDPATGDEVYSIEASNSPDAALSPDGSRLYVLGAGGSDELVAFDAESGDEIWRTTVKYRVYYIPGVGPSILGVSPNDEHVYVHSYDNLGDFGDYGGDAAEIPTWVQVIDADTGAHVLDTEKIPGYCHAEIHSSADSHRIFEVCMNTGIVRTSNSESGDLVEVSEVSGKIIGSIQAPDSNKVYLVGNAIRSFDTETGQLADHAALDELSVSPGLSGLTTLSPNGTRLYVALGTVDNDGEIGTQDVREIAVFDTRRWTEIDRVTLDVPLKGGAFTMSPDGRYIYASEQLQSDSDGKLIRIDVESGESSTVLVRNVEILRVLVGGRTQPEREALPVEPPSATLAYEDQTQVRESFNYCWAEAGGSMRCVESDMAPPKEPALWVPTGASLTFTLDEIDQFEILGAYVHPLVTIEGSSGQVTWGYPTIDVPFDQSAVSSTITADLPAGEYALAVEIEVPLYPDNPGTATYFFRVGVYDEESGRPPENDLDLSELAEFDGFPVWSLGETFGEFVLDDIVEHHYDTTWENFAIEFNYVAEDGRTDVGIQVTSRGPLSEAELQAREESRQGLGEPVVINGVDGWMTRVDDNVRTIELDLEGGHLTILATDQETALAAAESVQRVNGSVGVEVDPVERAFPDAEIVHVVSVEEPLGGEGETFTVETWIDQTNGDVVVRRMGEDGQLHSLTVKHGLTVREYRSERNSLNVTTMLSEDDVNLPDPTDHLNMYRSILQWDQEAIEQRDFEVTRDESFDGRPAVKLVLPFSDSGEVLGIVTVYLDPTTLFPLAVIGPEGDGQTFSYPTVETFERDGTPEGVFDPEIPEAEYTYVREHLSPESAAEFEEYPIWWLGEEFSGYNLHRIERFEETTPHDTPSRDRVYIEYRLEPGDNESVIQIHSQGSLSDQELASRISSREVNSEEIEIDGNRAWLSVDPQTGRAGIEIEFPDGYALLSAPNEEQALAAVDALKRMNE